MPSEQLPRRPGRIRAAILALGGHPIVPEQIRAEWAAWQLELEAICDKIGAAANRLQTRHKRDLDRALEELQELRAEQEDPHPVGSYNASKRELWRRVREHRRGLQTNGAANVSGVEGE